MRALFVALVPVVVSLMAVTVIKNSQNIVKPNRKDGQAPIGNARFGDYNQLDGTLSFWQQEPHRKNKYQL